MIDLNQRRRKDGAPSAWQLKIYNVGHVETPEMRQDIIAFFNGVQQFMAWRRQEFPALQLNNLQKIDRITNAQNIFFSPACAKPM